MLNNVTNTKTIATAFVAGAVVGYLAYKYAKKENIDTNKLTDTVMSFAKKAGVLGVGVAGARACRGLGRNKN